jgi:hypothetical protein
MPSHTLHVVQAFEEREGGIMPVEPKACPSAASARALASRLAQTHVGVIAWSRTGDPELGDWGPPEVLIRSGVIPDEFEAGGGVDWRYRYTLELLSSPPFLVSWHVPFPPAGTGRV